MRSVVSVPFPETPLVQAHVCIDAAGLLIFRKSTYFHANNQSARSEPTRSAKIEVEIAGHGPQSVSTRGLRAGYDPHP